MGDYHKLDVWHRSRAMALRVHALIEKLPRAMQENAREQLGEAADSVRKNISEGTGLNSDPMLAKHLRHALGSANEVQDDLEALNARELLPAEDQDLIAEQVQIRAMVASFLKKVLNDIGRAKKRKQTPKRRPEVSSE